ncbi:hypothetical protein ACKWTF_011675 [Chironomus riparius]
MASSSRSMHATTSSVSEIRQINEAIPQEVKEMYAKTSVNRKRGYKPRNFDGAGSTRILDFFKKQDNERKSMFNANRPNATQQPTKQLKTVNQEDYFINANKASLEARTLAEEINEILIDKEKIDVKNLIIKNTQMIMKMQESQECLTAAMISRDTQIMGQMTKRMAECNEFFTNEVNEIRQDIEDIKAKDDVEKMSTVMACKRDLMKIWIRFTYVDDVNELKDMKNPPLAVKTIMSQLKIDLSNIQWPVESAHFQLKTFSANQQAPETALECTFVNSTIANRVKMGIRNFNNRLEEDGKIHLIRYRVATDFSFTVRRIVKICNELKRCEVVDKVLITNDGIKVLHKEIERSNQKTSMQQVKKASSSLVNSMSQLDSLRRMLQDFNFKVPANMVYNQAYFEMSHEKRLEMRNEVIENMIMETEKDLELTASDNESMYSSQHDHFE